MGAGHEFRGVAAIFSRERRMISMRLIRVVNCSAMIRKLSEMAAIQEVLPMPGRLVYLMGPSGAGKDSLLDGARDRLGALGCRVARRVITRSAEAVGEDAIAVSADEFGRRLLAGDFVMSWRANGLAYGIGKEIDTWLAAGHHVLVNGSRGYLHEARRRYPCLLPILLEVEPDVLRSRLLRRGRETVDEIDARLARNAVFASGAADGDSIEPVRLDNSGVLESAIIELLKLVQDCSQRRC